MCKLINLIDKEGAGMGKRHLSLIRKAIERHGKQARPISSVPRLCDAFTENNGKLVFWYEDETGSTKIIQEDKVYAS